MRAVRLDLAGPKFFKKRPRKSVDTNFNIGIKSIKIVEEYTYLGRRLTPTGNITLALDQ